MMPIIKVTDITYGRLRSLELADVFAGHEYLEQSPTVFDFLSHSSERI
jgi:hypothetical protein